MSCLILNFELTAPVIKEANKYIIHTSIGAKLFIGNLDYCLKVDEPSTNAKKMRCVHICSKFSVKCERIFYNSSA